MKSNIPTLPADTPQDVLDALQAYTDAHDALERAENAIPGDNARRVAEDADRRALADAVRDGRDAVDIGTPHVDAWTKARETNRAAASVLSSEVQEATLKAGQVLAEHRGALLSLALPDAEKAAEKYRAAIANLDKARDALNDATSVVAWVIAIGQRGGGVPNIGRTVDPAIRAGLRTATYGDVLAGLEHDADRVATMVSADEKRLIDEQRERDRVATHADRVAARRAYASTMSYS